MAGVISGLTAASALQTFKVPNASAKISGITDIFESFLKPI
jgi:hypothetical protein